MRFCRIVILCVTLSPLTCFAQARWEMETDPTAFALPGFSAHVGHPIFAKKLRLQLGAFGAETPQWIHGNRGFTEYARGATLKMDYFISRPLTGLFIGADSNYSRVGYELDQHRKRAYRNIGGLGPRVG